MKPRRFEVLVQETRLYETTYEIMAMSEGHALACAEDILTRGQPTSEQWMKTTDELVLTAYTDEPEPEPDVVLPEGLDEMFASDYESD